MGADLAVDQDCSQHRIPAFRIDFLANVDFYILFFPAVLADRDWRRPRLPGSVRLMLDLAPVVPGRKDGDGASGRERDAFPAAATDDARELVQRS